MKMYDFVPVSTDNDKRFIVMREKKTYLVDLVSDEYIQTGEEEDPYGLISAEKFGIFERTFSFPNEAMDAIGEIMESEWVEV